MYLSRGNRKLEKASRLFLIWNLPAVESCPGATPTCRRYCYARKAERMYRNVLECRKRNMAASRRPDFVSGIVALIEKAGPRPYFRVHESGDFYSQEYLDAWFAVARAFPETKFLAYTQSFHLDFRGCPPNFVIRFSVWPDTDYTKVPCGPLAFIGDSRHHDPARFDAAVPCRGKCASCLLCWERSGDVRFKIH